MSDMARKQKGIPWSQIMVFSMWFASWNILWGIYNNYLPVLLQAGGVNYNIKGASSALGFGLGAFAVGIVMSLDNVAGSILKLIFGPVADRVKSKKKILLISGSVAAIAYALIPFGFMGITPETSGKIDLLGGSFIFTLIVLSVMIAAWGIAELTESSLFQVILSSEQRAKAAAYRVFVGGFGIVVTLLLGNMLYSVHMGLPFWIGAAFYAVTLVLYALVIKEPKNTHFETRGADGKLESIGAQVRDAVHSFSSEAKKAFLYISLSKFLLIFGVMAFQTYGSSYIVNVLGISEAAAGNYTIIFFAGYMISALPAGYLANKVGRKNMLLIALFIYALVGIIQYLSGALATLIPGFFLLGLSTGISDVIPVCMAADTVPDKKYMGTTMGVYFFIASMSAIIAVPLFGWIFEATNNNWNLMWLGVAITGVIGLILMALKRGKIGEMKPSVVA
ncbi:MAG: MFS transporter [Spirochaetota bacterium]